MKSYCKQLRITHEVVYKAYEKWLSGDSGRKNAWRIKEEYGSIHNLVDEIIYEIDNRELRFRPIRYTLRRERGRGKERCIGQESVKQQIVDYIVLYCLDDFYNKKIGFYQVASVKGKGPLFGARQVQKWIQGDDAPIYAHCDIKKCYESFDKEAIYHFYKKYIHSRDLMYVISCLLKSYKNGLSIGSAFSLKTSQLMLSFAYHKVEEIHWYRRGVSHKSVTHQIWYADDFYLFSTNKRELKKAIRQVAIFLCDNFGLFVKPWKISRTDSEPVDFAGFVIRKDRITVRDETYLRVRRTYTRYQAKPTLKRARSVCSYWGYFKHTDSKTTVDKHGYGSIFRNAKHLVSGHSKRLMVKFKGRCAPVFARGIFPILV